MSTKYDVRVKRIEEQLNAGGKLPPDARGPYIKWWNIGEAEPDFAEIKAELMAKYGTTEGAEFLCIRWGTPDEEDRKPIEGT
jgi:hypothetical protein